MQVFGVSIVRLIPAISAIELAQQSPRAPDDTGGSPGGRLGSLLKSSPASAKWLIILCLGCCPCPPCSFGVAVEAFRLQSLSIGTRRGHYRYIRMLRKCC